MKTKRRIFKMTKKIPRLKIELSGAYYFENFQRRYKFPKRRYNLDIKSEIDCMIMKCRKGACILDAGCGDGSLSGGWTDDYKIIGIDCQKESIDFCRKQYPEGEWLLEDLYHLHFEDEFFDLIICSMVIEHFKIPDRALFEMSRVLKDEGQIVIITPNYGSCLWRLIEAIYFPIFEGNCKAWTDDVHPSRFRKKSLSEMANKCFSVCEIFTVTYGMTLVLRGKKQ
ncbi:MAG: class I SAM-dependent methyltransferase [Candidatus Omnitrophota bacterium]